MKRFLNLSLLLSAFIALAPVAALATELVMVDEEGCIWCQRWEEEIGPSYPNTTEGAFAPLRKINIRDVADKIEISRRVNFTPTFLLVENGRELARLEGYPGEHFFFPLLGDLLGEHTAFKMAE